VDHGVLVPGVLEALPQTLAINGHQALMLRGSRDFADVAAYQQFLKALTQQLNRGRRARFAEELKVIRGLPPTRLEAVKRLLARVDCGSLIHVDRNAYSVTSRLIGQKVEVRLYVGHLEVWYGQKKVEELPRLRGRNQHQVNYRHVIDWLVRKPGAFADYRYQADLFPSSLFRVAYDRLTSQHAGNADTLRSSRSISVVTWASMPKILCRERGFRQSNAKLRNRLPGLYMRAGPAAIPQLTTWDRGRNLTCNCPAAMM
jgi:hypothetical protein